MFFRLPLSRVMVLFTVTSTGVTVLFMVTVAGSGVNDVAQLYPVGVCVSAIGAS